MAKKLYVKKPIPVEAIQWTGLNWNEIKTFCGDCVELFHRPSDPDNNIPHCEILTIHTLEGDHMASKNDYIIKGIHGEFYPCKEDIFEETYTLVKVMIPRSLTIDIENALRLFININDGRTALSEDIPHKPCFCDDLYSQVSDLLKVECSGYKIDLAEYLSVFDRILNQIADHSNSSFKRMVTSIYKSLKEL